MGTFNLAQRIAIKNPYSNIDAYYGPYSSDLEHSAIENALLNIPQNIRKIGLTVGIINENTKRIKEYWFLQKGLIEGHLELVEKNSSSLIMSLLSEPEINTDRNVPIYIMLDGDATPSSIEIYSSSDGINYSLTNYRYPGIIAKNVELSIDLNLDSDKNPRTVYYRIRVIDDTNNVAETAEGEKFLEFVVNYKEIETIISGNSGINAVKVKSLDNLKDRDFIFSISKISKVLILNPIKIILTDNNGYYDEYTEVTYSNDISGYKVTLENLRNEHKGKDIKVRVNYTSEGIQKTIDTTILTILAAGVFTNIDAYGPPNVYLNTKFSIHLYFEAENEYGYLVRIKDGDIVVVNSYYLSYVDNIISMLLDITTLEVGVKYLDKVLDIYLGDSQIPLKLINIRVMANDETLFVPGESDELYGYYNNINSILASANPLKSYILDLDCFIPYTLDNLEVLFKFPDNLTITKELITFAGFTYPTPILENVSLGFMFNVIEGLYHYSALSINGVICYKHVVENPEGTSTPYDVTRIINKLTINNFNFYYNFGTYLPSAVTTSSSEIDYDSPHIVTRNYLARHKSESAEELQMLYLTAIPPTGEFYDLYTKKKGKGGRGIIPGVFGNIGDEKYPATDEEVARAKQNPENYTVLMKQNTKLKSALLKKIGVICYWRRTENGLNEGLVEVHTQGTSTLDYSLPNFKFTFINMNGDTVTPQIIPNENNGYYEESVLTAKADYMDSSHLNNTPTATYFNKVVQSQAFHGEYTGGNNEYDHRSPVRPKTLSLYDYRSPSAKLGGLDAITGTPIILNIKDIYYEEEWKTKTQFSNYGSFMLNIDKTGTVLNFDIPNTKCISFEGTSNEDNSGHSSRFIIDDIVLSDFNYVNEHIDDYDTSWYNSTNQSVKKVLEHLAEGLEYRYPDGDIIDGNDFMPFEHFKRLFKMFYWVANSDNLTKEEYTGIFNKDRLNSLSMFTLLDLLFIDDIESHSSDQDYPFDEFDFSELTENTELSSVLLEWIYRTIFNGKTFNDYFSFEYCSLYFIQLMNFGQTDNLGKNCMFDLWTEDGLWYPRPYDLDSLTGLNNDGLDIIPPFVEILPIFSLNYSIVNQNSTVIFNNRGVGTKYEQIFIDNPSITINEFLNDYIYPEYHLLYDSKIVYYGTAYNRYGYSSPTSKLWINFFKNFRNEINTFYNSLKNVYVDEDLNVNVDSSKNTILLYDSDTILKFCKDKVVDKLGVLQYNTDFRYKYLINTKNSEQFAFGNRLFKYKDWLSKRFSFCDVFFKHELYEVNFRSGSTNLEFSYPQYVLYKYAQPNAQDIIEYYDGTNPINLSFVAAAVNYNLYISPDNITSGALYRMLNSCDPKLQLNNLVTLDTDRDFFKVATIANNYYMNNLALNGIIQSYSERIIPINVRTLSITNSSHIPELDENYQELRELTINNCNYLNLSIKNCSNLTTLRINDCTNLNLSLLGLTNIQTLDISRSAFSRLTINGCDFNILNLKGLTLESLNFDGEISHIGIVDLRTSKVNLPINILNLEGAEDHGLKLLLNNSTILGIEYNSAKAFDYLSLTNSTLYYFRQIGSNENVFDGNLIENPSLLIAVTLDSSVTNLRTQAFNLSGCKNIEKVSNFITSTNTNYTSLFNGCTALTTINNCNIKCFGTSMFNQCVNLTSISGTITLLPSTSDPSVIDASNMFSCCNLLSYSTILSILSSNSGITNFTGFMAGKTFDFLESDSNRIITIDLSYYSNATDLTRAFDIISSTSYSAVNRNTTVTYTVIFNGVVPENVQTINTAFYRGFSNVTYKFNNWYNNDNGNITSFISGCSNLTNCGNAFGGNDFSFFYENQQIFLPLLWDGFFPYTVTTVDGMFASCLNLTFDSNFKFSALLVSAVNTFYNSQTKKDLSDLLLKYDILNFFSSSSALLKITYCFRNCKWAKSTDILSRGDNPTATLNVFGAFADCNSTFTFGFNGKWKSEYVSSEQSTPRGSSIPYDSSLGVYKGDTITVGQDINLAGILCYNATRLFNNATLSTNSQVINLIINTSGSITQQDIRHICANMTIVNTQDETTYLKVTFSNSVARNGTSAFENCVLFDPDDTDLIILPNTLTNARRMFYGSNIKIFPDLHNTSLTDSSYMFYNCTSLRQIENPVSLDVLKSYGNVTGTLDYEAFVDDGPNVFVLPKTIITIERMFYGCISLRNGIPFNFIAHDNNIISLSNVFNTTSILFVLSTDYTACALKYELNISEMFPNVTNVDSLFEYNWVNLPNLENEYWLKIHNRCFSNCISIDRLFAQNAGGKSVVLSITNIDLGNATSLFGTFHNFAWTSNINITMSSLRINNMSLTFSAGSNVSTINDNAVSQAKRIYENISDSLKAYTNFRGMFYRYVKNTTTVGSTSTKIGEYSNGLFSNDIYYQIPSPAITAINQQGHAIDNT